MVLPAFGVLSVPCPTCGSRPGRPCPNRRGYLLTGGAHRARRTAWLAQEHAEAPTSTAGASGTSCGV